jgi:hypothetical protein
MFQSIIKIICLSKKNFVIRIKSLNWFIKMIWIIHPYNFIR